MPRFKGRDKMNKTHNKYITALNYAGKTLLLPSATSGVSLLSFTTVIAMPVGIANASVSLVFCIVNGIVKMF